MFKLLSAPDSNPKVAKGNNKLSDYISTIMHLRPISTKICPFQVVAKCKAPCLDNAGMARVFPSIHKARERKTALFLDNRAEFMSLLVLDVIKFIGYCKRRDKKPAIRLNGTSDIQWETIEVECGQNIFQMFPQVQWYDYTKIPNRKVSHIPNYHLTWSYSEANKKYADYFDSIKYNVAVVFKEGLPKTFKGLRVIDGDKTDMRFLDGNKRVVVGLKAKGDAKTDTSGFVINWKLTTSERRRLNYGV